MTRPIFPELTERENEILDLIIQGYSNKEICKKLVLAMPTVKCHIQNLYLKHNLYNDCGYSVMRLRLALNYLNKIITDIKAQNVRLIEQNRELQKELEPFKDDYFKGLDNKAIAELAKKSIRITTENSRLENCLQEIKEIAERGKGFAECWMITGEQKTNVLAYANAILEKISEVENE